MKLEEILDSIKKFLDRFRTIVFTGLMVVVILSLTSNGCQRKDIIELTERLTGLDLQNVHLTQVVSANGDTIKKKQAEIIALQRTIDSLQGINTVLKGKETNLIAVNQKLQAELLKISEDSSYNWLQQVGYPFGGDNKSFGFNGPQVKAIHSDKVSYNGMVALNFNLKEQLYNCELRGDAQKELTGKTKEKYELAMSSNESLQQLTANAKEECELYQKQLKKEKRNKTIYKISTVVGLLVGFALGSL